MADRDERLLWGVTITSPFELVSRPHLLWRGWHGDATVAYPGEPNRPLVFSTRAAARAWCRAKHTKYRLSSDTCAQWRFREVRVRERYEPIKRGRR